MRYSPDGINFLRSAFSTGGSLGKVTDPKPRTTLYSKCYATVNLLCVVNLLSHNDLLPRPPCGDIIFLGFFFLHLSSQRRVHGIRRSTIAAEFITSLIQSHFCKVREGLNGGSQVSTIAYNCHHFATKIQITEGPKRPQICTIADDSARVAENGLKPI